MRKYINLKECINEIKDIEKNEEIEVEKEIKMNDPSINFVVVVLLNRGVKIINNNFKIYKTKSRLVDYLIYEGINENKNKNYIKQVLKGEK